MEKKLTRSRRNRMVAGVCSGFADFFGLDVTLVRLFMFLFVMLAGTGLLIYLGCWIIIPEEQY